MRHLRTRAQFQALLRQAPVARTRHFALHRCRLGAEPAPTGVEEALFAPAAPLWLGAMAPKRWARRAVTRNTIRRQVYAVAAGLETSLAEGAYLVRLRAAFATAEFPSATSAALRRAVRQELQQLFDQAVA